jgi:hypothetical protein
MADGERKMLFDIRGRRKNVVRVVYGLLAALMGLSLLLVVGPFSVDELIGGGGGGSSATSVFEDQAENIERRLAKAPNDEALLLALTRVRINAANSRSEIDPETGIAETATPQARDEYEQALEAWNRYLKLADDEPSANIAQLVAIAFFGLAERGSTDFSDVESNIQTAAAAQSIVAERRPSIGSQSTLAIYEYFNGNFAAGDKARNQAIGEANSKEEAKNVKKQLDEYRKRGKQFDKQKKAAAKAEKGKGKETLENPLGVPVTP